MTKCDEITKLIPAYSLGALTETEKNLVEEHVAACPRCSVLLDEYRATAENLLHTVPPVVAPDHFYADFRRRLARERGSQTLVRTWWGRLINSMTRPALTVTAVLFFLLVCSHLYWDLKNNQLGDHQAILEQQLDAQAEAIYILSEGGYSVEFEDMEEAIAAHGMIILPPDGESAVVMLEHMPPLPKGKVYQLWFVHNQERRDSGGLFSVNSSGRGMTIADPPQLLSYYQASEVTVEPIGGSPNPTGRRLILCRQCLEKKSL